MVLGGAACMATVSPRDLRKRRIDLSTVARQSLLVTPTFDSHGSAHLDEQLSLLQPSNRMVWKHELLRDDRNRQEVAHDAEDMLVVTNLVRCLSSTFAASRA